MGTGKDKNKRIKVMLQIKNGELKVKHSKLGLINKYLLISSSFTIFKLLNTFNRIIFHVELPIKQNVYKKKLRLGHTHNITINSNTILGENITLHHNVTIGSKQWGNNKGAPTIMDDVIIYPHSIIVGNITIRKNSIIGAGSVVLKNVEKNTIVAGNPAKKVGIIILNS